MQPLNLRAPGLFITATDTEVGKTLVTCALVHAIRRQRPNLRLAAAKPFASGCDERDGELESEDARHLVHAMAAGRSDAPGAAAINPIRYRLPLAPAAAAEREGAEPDMRVMAAALTAIADRHDFLLVEGVGGLLVPLDRQHTVRDLIRAVAYPVIVVARAGLGTINHTAMTVELLQHAGCTVRGIVLNDAAPPDDISDVSRQTNRLWIERTTGCPVLASLPWAPGAAVMLAQGTLPDALIQPLLGVDWVGS